MRLIFLILLAPFTSATAQITLSEFCASNNTTLQDLDGQSSDWIELRNTTGAIINIGGYFLTDDQSDLTKWQFPNPTLVAGNGHILVFASGKSDVLTGTQLHTNFQLSASGEYLAVVAANGSMILDEILPMYPQQYPDVSFGKTSGTGAWVHFTNATPGSTNAAAGNSYVRSITWAPALPGNNDVITVTARVAPPPSVTISSVLLRYRVNFGGEISVAMTLSLGQWSAAIPASVSGPGDMVRWRVQATDSTGAATVGPLYADPNNSPQYAGIMIPDPAVNTPLKTLHWFMQNTGAANNTTGARASVWYAGVLYDNVLARARGNSSIGWPKKSHKIDFNSGYHMQEADLGGGVEEINLNSTWGDKSFIRQVLAGELYEAAGAPGSLVFPMRVQRNGSFYSVVNLVEQPDERLLERAGLHPRGALYKMFNTCTSSGSGVEKKTRKWEPNFDLATMISNITQPTGPALDTWIFDNVDVPAVISYLVATCLIHDNDHVAKNYYVYRDTEGDGEWQFLPWDKDLTWGRNYTLSGGVLNDTIWAANDPYSHPFFGDQQHPKVDGPWNRFIDACLRVPRVEEMYLRRLRTFMDEVLQPTGTPSAQLVLEARIAQLQADMGADCALDQAAWGVPSYWSSSLTFINASNQISSAYLTPRRNHLYNTHGTAGTGLIPDPSAGAPIQIVQAEPSTANPDEAYIHLRNCGSESVDVSDWYFTGGISFTFPKGTVVLAGDSVFVVEDVPGFRARTSGPGGGQGLLVAGKWSGALAPTDSVLLFNAGNQLITNTGDFSFQVGTTGVGDATVAMSGASPFSPFWIPVSFDTSNTIGCGPVVGLQADALFILTLPANSAPFNGTTDFAGSYIFSVPAGSLAPGTSVDARAVVLNPIAGTWMLSAIERINF